MAQFNPESLMDSKSLDQLKLAYECVTYSPDTYLTAIVASLNSLDDTLVLSYCRGMVSSKPSVNNPFLEHPCITFTYSKKDYSKILQFVNRFIYYFDQIFNTELVHNAFIPELSYKQCQVTTGSLVADSGVKIMAITLTLKYNSFFNMGTDLKTGLEDLRTAAWYGFYVYVQELFTKDFVRTFLPVTRSYQGQISPNVLYCNVPKTKISAVDSEIEEFIACEGYKNIFTTKFINISVSKTRTALFKSKTTGDYYVVCHADRKNNVDFFGYIPDQYGTLVEESFRLAIQRAGMDLEEPEELSCATEWPVYFGIET